MLEKLFILGVIFIPFSGISGVSLMGEMRSELSAHIFLFALFVFFMSYIPGAARDGKLSRVKLLPKFMALFFCAIGVSLAFNFSAIFESIYRERTGLNKFITSSMVAVFGFALAYLSYFVVLDKWKSTLLKPISISVIICVIYSFFELGSWVSSGFDGIYTALFNMTHDANFSMNAGLSRLMSVSFEPPAFANYAGFAWPWIYAGVVVSRGPQKTLYSFLWAALTVMIVLASSRTGMIVLSGCIITLILLYRVYLPQKVARSSFKVSMTTILVGLIFLSALIFADKFNELVDMVVVGQSVSNLSRLASNTAAISMFLDRPFFGFGFGQYGFNGAEYMPAWGWYSWEIRGWFSDLGQTWPPVFSLYARFAAELGLFGVIIWTYIWIKLMCLVMSVSLESQRITGVLPSQAYPLVLSFVCVLLSGIPNDSLRTPMIWIVLGLGCRFVNDMEIFIEKAKAGTVAGLGDKSADGGLEGSVGRSSFFDGGNEVVRHKH